MGSNLNEPVVCPGCDDTAPLHPMTGSEPLAKVVGSCGRLVLLVATVAVAMQGDPCRDGDLPEHLYDQIPAGEMATATIGGKPAKDLPLQAVRFFRCDRWNGEMLKYVAEQINARARAEC